jgi:hypothetical protein
MDAVFPGGLVHVPPNGRPPGQPGQGLHGPPMQFNPSGVIYYPPQAYQQRGNKVAIISDTTCDGDTFCWVPKRQHHSGVGTYEALEAALNQYDDNSIDVLILSGATGGRCNCATSNSANNNVYLGGPGMPPKIYDLIRRKLKKPGGEVIIASCNAGSSWQNPSFFWPWERKPLPNYVQQTANKCRCPVTACPKGTNGTTLGDIYAAGGSGDAPWVTVYPSK